MHAVTKNKIRLGDFSRLDQD